MRKRTKYISKEGWLALFMVCAFTYFPVRTIASVWFGI